MSALRATDTVMPTAEDTVHRNPMRPPPDSPRTAGEAVRVFFRHPSPLILLVTLLGLGAMRWQAGGFAWQDAAIALGVWMYFPFNEWLIHKFILHYRPRQILGRTVDFYLPKTHRRHHADPWNLTWVFVPRHVHALVLSFLAVVYLLASSWRPELLTFGFVYLLFGLHYEWVHYLTHITWCPPLAYYERRVLEHRWHHFRNENYWWGVSFGTGDRVLGTAPDAKDIARSGTNRDLGLKR
ncbi:MAG TPA: sterol desaturase family protein [Aquabacterium sp.]|uniref:sterol desaturase family protein n=1 Tax=Aquabacterium sp. TaxID=1872578 RepID=UPI002E3392F5|nr:sterol desaturase family protein [Aquabacterium sp.]HEX5354814.1 sterol desaturase family protein [Aquabacterium sp.]